MFYTLIFISFNFFVMSSHLFYFLFLYIYIQFYCIPYYFSFLLILNLIQLYLLSYRYFKSILYFLLSLSPFFQISSISCSNYIILESSLLIIILASVLISFASQSFQNQNLLHFFSLMCFELLNKSIFQSMYLIYFIEYIHIAILLNLSSQMYFSIF